ncbi:tripartite tricarboxylate transporter substrate binding protein [Cochlodiniinecator piscidefendens]|uniref:tripartite tricarboxylate transporter substrate binding protein n=1 Tax=Cochlodiniinecator piscidefendens TaxID=2715756 RepID=UPI00140E637B|nr:tripartite tricarboxylate transporter substrate binding protein [Cochlodiniinecator piscidefendens]
MKKFFAAVAMSTALLPNVAFAEYPEKPVEFVIPFPPGDLEDLLTRIIADEFQEAYGVPAAVVNKPGGGGGPFPGAISVATAPADGYTIGSFVIGVPVVGPQIGIPELTPNPFEPIGIFLTYPFVIAASGSAPYATIEELSAYAQNNDVTFGHFGMRSIPRRHMVAAAETLGFAFNSEAGFDALDCNTLASGDADVISTTLQLIAPCVDDLNILAAVTNERISTLPDVPTMGEIVPELDLSTWNGLFVHRDTPAEVRARIAEVAVRALNSDEALELAENTGAVIYWKDAAEAQAQIESDIEILQRIDALVGDN